MADRMKPPEPILRIRVTCTELPGTRFRDGQDPHCPIKEPVFLGIQHGQTVIESVPADRPRVMFHPSFRVGRKKDGSPNFLGEFAQGAPPDRFFYLSWGVHKSDGHFVMFRRLKIRLGHLKWARIQRAIEADEPIDVVLRMTDRRGGPLCATPPADCIEWME